MKKQTLQWHPAFQAALQVELREDRDFLAFHVEYHLSKKPLQMDTLIIKQEKGHVVRKSIGKIFRQHNIVEYKSPEDYISVNDFYRVMGYACVYQSDTKKVKEILPEEVTITLACSHYPRELIEHLKEQYKVRIRKKFKGIYYIEGLMFPTQVLITNQLPKKEYAWLARLRGGLKLEEDITLLGREYKKNMDDPLYQAVMELIIRANVEQYEEGKKMCDALRELFADEVEERVERRIIEFNLSLVRKKRAKGMSIKETAEILEVEEEVVQKIIHALEEFPDKTDKEIVDYLIN